MRKQSWIITCDRCDEPGTMPEDNTLPSGWLQGWMQRANLIDFDRRDFCPKCGAEWRQLMIEQNRFYERWFRGESLHQTLDLMGVITKGNA